MKFSTFLLVFFTQNYVTYKNNNNVLITLKICIHFHCYTLFNSYE